MPEANVEQTVPMLWVRDIARSTEFYIGLLGFTMTKSWVDEGKLRWCWLEHGRAALMLQEFWREGPHKNLPEGAVGVGVSINFLCKDALAIHHRVRSKGVESKTPFVGNGMWVVELSDPDGYSVNFESPTDVEEETLYSDHE